MPFRIKPDFWNFANQDTPCYLLGNYAILGRMASDKVDPPLHLPTVFHPDEDLEDVASWYDPTRLEKVRRAPQRSTNVLHDTFDLIGGVPRMAAWADKNEGEFFTKLFSKTVERAGKVEHSGEIKIVSAVPRTVLDGEVEEADFEDV